MKPKLIKYNRIAGVDYVVIKTKQLSECSKLVQNDYMAWLDWVGNVNPMGTVQEIEIVYAQTKINPNEWDKNSLGFWWFGLVSLFNGISTSFRLFNAKAIPLEEQ